MSSLNRQCRLLKLTCAQSSDHELVNTVEYDFSDASNDKLDSKASIKMIDCKNGTYTSDKERNGQPSYKPITPSQLAEMDAAGSHPCNCEICAARARNGMEMKLAGSLRGGKKRGFYKYGEGQVLGEEETNTEDEQI
jgi:hypothetical protein